MGFKEVSRGGVQHPDGFTRATYADIKMYLDGRGRDKFAFGASLLNPRYHLSLSVETLPTMNDGRVMQHEARVLHTLSQQFTTGMSSRTSPRSEPATSFGIIREDSRPRVLSLFDGEGNNSWYLSEAFGEDVSEEVRVHAYETNIDLYAAAYTNIQQTDKSGSIVLHNADNMIDVLDIASRKKFPVAAIYIDPPVLPYEPQEQLYLSMVDYRLTSWLDAACQASDVVGLHLPGNVLDLALEEAADRMGRNLIIHSHHLEGTPDQTDTKIAYFLNGRDKQEPIKEAYTLPNGSTQWQLAA